MKIELSPLSEENIDVIYDLFQSMPNENGFENQAYGLSKGDFFGWLKKSIDQSNGIGLKDGRVPQTTFILYIRPDHILKKFLFFIYSDKMEEV